MKTRICVVAIARDEERFLDEWLTYHRLLGVDHFRLYDDGHSVDLAERLARHRDYLTIVPWSGRSDHLPGRNRQTKAYTDAVNAVGAAFTWVGFLDIDEFVVLRDRETLPDFLEGFGAAAAVSLNWHVFGHNGYYEDPPGLVTASLTRRMRVPSRNEKTFSRPEAIRGIDSAHSCLLHPGAVRVDPNGRPFTVEVYPGKTERAHINHYQCRSFQRWMARVGRGDVNVDYAAARARGELWRVEDAACLRQFVETVARDKNELVDEFMLRFVPALESALATAGPVPCGELVAPAPDSVSPIGYRRCL